jgi:hypothetical protein
MDYYITLGWKVFPGTTTSLLGPFVSKCNAVNMRPGPLKDIFACIGLSLLCDCLQKKYFFHVTFIPGKGNVLSLSFLKKFAEEEMRLDRVMIFVVLLGKWIQD